MSATELSGVEDEVRRSRGPDPSGDGRDGRWSRAGGERAVKAGGEMGLGFAWVEGGLGLLDCCDVLAAMGGWGCVCRCVRSVRCSCHGEYDVI